MLMQHHGHSAQYCLSFTYHRSEFHRKGVFFQAFHKSLRTYETYNRGVFTQKSP